MWYNKYNEMREVIKMTYKIFEFSATEFMVYRVTTYGETLVKVFKTRKSAENWVKKHS